MNEESAAARSSAETQQLAAQSRLDEQWAALELREAAHLEAIAVHEHRQAEAQSIQESLAQRQAELEQARTALALEQERFSTERYTQQAAVQSQIEELQRREAELAQRETLQANAAGELSQHAGDTVVAEPSGAEIAELTARRTELEEAEAVLQQAANDLAAAKVQFETQQAEALAAQQRQTEELAATAGEINAGRNAVAEAESQLRAERELLFNDRLRQEAELRQASDTLQQRIAELDAREKHAGSEAVVPLQPLGDSAPAGDLAEREAALAEQFVALERQQASLHEQQEEFDHTRARSSQRLAADAEELKRDREKLAADQAEMVAEMEKLAAERDAFETQRRLDFDRRDADQSLEERRSAFVHDTGDDEDCEASSQPLQEFSRALPPPRRQAALDTVRSGLDDTTRAPQCEEEESIEQYMAALLNRSRSGQVSPATQPVERRRNKRKSDVQKPEEEALENPVAAPEVPVLDIPAAPLQLERRRTPEVRPDMNVLREIGITHARSAIATHGQQRTLRQAYGTLATSLVCFAAAFLVFFFGTHPVFHLTGMAIVVIGIYWLGTSIWAVNKVLNSMQQRRGGLRATLAEIDAEIEALRKETAAEAEEAK
jgi:hypothetical protein